MHSIADTVFDTFPWPQFEMGSAPAPGAADRALAVGRGAHASGATPTQSRHAPPSPKGCREGAATDTRGACAPQTIAKIDAVAAAARALSHPRIARRESVEGRPRGARHRRPHRLWFKRQKGFAHRTPRPQPGRRAQIEKVAPVTAPGRPKNYPDAKKLVTGDCIRP